MRVYCKRAPTEEEMKYHVDAVLSGQGTLPHIHTLFFSTRRHGTRHDAHGHDTRMIYVTWCGGQPTSNRWKTKCGCWGSPLPLAVPHALELSTLTTTIIFTTAAAEAVVCRVSCVVCRVPCAIVCVVCVGLVCLFRSAPMLYSEVKTCF
jgi:hypothetical protein